MKGNLNSVASLSAGLNTTFGGTGMPYEIKAKKPEILVNPMHTTLDLSTLISFFGQLVESIFYWEGLRYSNPRDEISVTLGDDADCAIGESLSLDGESLGTITVMKNRPFSDDEQAKFNFLCQELLHPLRNALMYYQALQLAMHDPLTGVGNRNALDQHLEREVSLAFRHNTPLSALELDIDFFKRVNDTLGHAAGDSALKHIAEIVTEALRNSDLFFRLGGEEFVCLLPSTQIEGANILAERIRLGIENSVCHFNEHQIELTVSIGVAQYNTGESATNFIDRADKALYSAKNSGRNQVKAA